MRRVVCCGIGDEAGASIEAQAAAHAALGWGTIELRTVEGAALAELDGDRFEHVASVLGREGVEVRCVASRIGGWARPITSPFERDVDELRALAPRLRALGARAVRVMSYLNDGLSARAWREGVLRRVASLAELAESEGLELLHENCCGWAGASAERSLELLEAVGSPALRLLFDTGNGVPYGYDATAFLADVLPHVAHVHVKDARKSSAGVVYTVPGEGDADVGGCLRLLAEAGYDGAASIEPHLQLVPHLGETTAHGDAFGAFVRCGRSLEQLLDAAAPVVEAVG